MEILKFLKILCSQNGQMYASRQTGKFSRRKQKSGNLRRFPENDSVQVLRMNFSLHLGQVMEILPFPRGTRTV